MKEHMRNWFDFNIKMYCLIQLCRDLLTASRNSIFFSFIGGPYSGLKWQSTFFGQGLGRWALNHGESVTGLNVFSLLASLRPSDLSSAGKGYVFLHHRFHVSTSTIFWSILKSSVVNFYVIASVQSQISFDVSIFPFSSFPTPKRWWLISPFYCKDAQRFRKHRHRQ